MDENPYQSPRASVVPPRRRRLRDWLALAAIGVAAAPILFGLELVVVYALQWFGIWF
jgi:hypothetical protein